MREERIINYYTLLELLPLATEAEIKKLGMNKSRSGIRIALSMHRPCTGRRKLEHN